MGSTISFFAVGPNVCDVELFLERERDAVKRPTAAAIRDLSLRDARLLKRQFRRQTDEGAEAVFEVLAPVQMGFGHTRGQKSQSIGSPGLSP